MDALSSLEIFAGAGGLALGLARAGFTHRALVELEDDACDTLRSNQSQVPQLRGADIRQENARDMDFSAHKNLCLLAAGVPCQPFSRGGKGAGDEDDRNLFPVVFRAVRETKPDIVVIENVKGLQDRFPAYFEYIKLQLEIPEVEVRASESWSDHGIRLLRHARDERDVGARYVVAHQALNAANFGVPQQRQRVFIVAFRADLGVAWSDLVPTHSLDALLYTQWVEGSYWEEHGLRRPRLPSRLTQRIERLRDTENPLAKARWRTVRDAFSSPTFLPAPTKTPNSSIANHILNPGAREYDGHTGSSYDMPAKALKAGVNGVPGGENTLRLENGSVRYFTIREAARLQGFPDQYVFKGSWCGAFRQLGNAVPVDLAEVMGQHVIKLYSARLSAFEEARRRRRA